MTGVFSKLNLKDQQEILVVDAPESFDDELTALDEVRIVRRAAAAHRISFALIFVTRKAQLDAFARLIAAKAEGDPVIWFAYPKATSRSWVCDFNRDTGWDAIRAAGFDSVPGRDRCRLVGAALSPRGIHQPPRVSGPSGNPGERPVEHGP